VSPASQRITWLGTGVLTVLWVHRLVAALDSTTALVKSLQAFNQEKCKLMLYHALSAGHGGLVLCDGCLERVTVVWDHGGADPDGSWRGSGSGPLFATGHVVCDTPR
jgi:hypothetical protein